MKARRDMNLSWPFARTRRESKAVVPLVTRHEGAAKLLRQPAPDMAGPGFLEGVYTQIQLAGNAFVEAAQIEGRTGVAALFALRPESVRPVTDARGWVEAWAVRERRGERVIRREETGWSPVLHLKLFNPVDHVMGLPPLGAARRALDLHNASAAAASEARFVLLDDAVVHASVSPGEVGLDMDWRAAGGEVAATLAFENRADLPWSVAHLRWSGDQLQWTRRGADVAESWTFPESANDGQFAVEVDTGSGFGGRFDVAVPEATLPGGAIAARVAEIGADGRTGPWVPIGTGTP